MRTVVLFSGGMDSFILLKLVHPEVALRVRIGSRYDTIEESRIHQLQKSGHLSEVQYVADNRLSLGDMERDDAIIPLRNLFFAMIGTFYGDVIMLAATHGDNNRDKDDVFMLQASSLLTYLARDPHYSSPTRKVSVTAPFRDKTKTEILRDYITNGNTLDALSITISCYNPVNGVACGNCLPCIRRYVAFAVNGYADYETYAQNPKTSAYAEQALDKARKGHRGREDADTIVAFS